jgi:monovalent cation:H+ antiporter-2, CPA2 family
MTVPTCDHFPNLTTEAAPDGDVCRQCVSMGDSWFHLRSCLGCGRVGCCDQSKNKHARAHWEEEDHPLIRSIEPGETWKYCFQDHFLVK